MVALAVTAMFGTMGLTVDIGWSFFVRKQAQAAADSAALAAVQAAFQAGPSGYTVGMASCPGAAGSLGNGCLYAAQNGFTTAGAQTVTLQGGVGAPPTAPYLTSVYWVTARVQQTVPQIFSGVFGNTSGTTGARATAAVLSSQVPGALILLNRQNDCVAMGTGGKTACGVDLQEQGGDAVNAKQGILMASTCDDTLAHCSGTDYAGEVGGSASVTSDFTGIRGTGTANANAPQWNKQWQNGLQDSSFFRDPLRTLGGQPPAPPATSNFPQAGCMINATGKNPANGQPYSPTNRLVLTSGKYYSVAVQGGSCNDGDPLQINGYVEFAACSSPPCSGFGSFTFFGGVSAGNASDIKFDPGEYVIAGVRGGNSAGTLFNVGNGAVLQDNTPLDANGQAQANTDAGELFIFTGPDSSGTWYPSLDTSGVPSTVLNGQNFGISGFQTGNDQKTVINLHGLNEDATNFPSSLKNFFDPGSTDAGEPVVFWQDQRNSVTKYYNGAAMNLPCIVSDQGSGSTCDNTAALHNTDSPELFLAASPNIHLYGTVYQPRGAWTFFSGGGNYAGPVRIITGGFTFQGSVTLDLSSLKKPLNILLVSLIE
jgi:hypothetical protein